MNNILWHIYNAANTLQHRNPNHKSLACETVSLMVCIYLAMLHNLNYILMSCTYTYVVTGHVCTRMDFHFIDGYYNTLVP